MKKKESKDGEDEVCSLFANNLLLFFDPLAASPLSTSVGRLLLWLAPIGRIGAHHVHLAIIVRV